MNSKTVNLILKNYKNPYKIQFHTFTNNKDNWYSNLNDAVKKIKEWHRDGYIDLRIYLEIYETENDYEECSAIENCIFSIGNFPY